MARKPYPSDVTDAQWRLVEHLMPAAHPGGRPRVTPMREVLNGVLYLVRTGCQWRSLPQEFPPWPTVHHYYRLMRIDGTWQLIHDRLRERVRHRAGRKLQPSAAIIDSQSVKTTEKGGSRVTTRASVSKDASVT
jgi:putative transposase